MKYIGLIITLALVFLLTACGQASSTTGSDNNQSDSATTAETQSAERETAEGSVINVLDIWNQYDKDPKKYKATYDGDLINATGVVTFIGEDSHGTPSMELSDKKNGTSYVLGVFGSYEEMSEVSVGDTVSIEGNFHIMSSDNMVVIKQCTIKKIYNEFLQNNQKLPETISFGAYPESEPISWKVLDEQDDKVLLMTNSCIASLAWHNTAGSVTWDNCDLRAWLNQDFLKEVFTEDEQKSILLSDLSNGDDMGYGTPVGENTQDKVFLLSTAEVEKYFPAEESRTVKPTAYAASHGAYTNDSGDCAWWLRSPGMTATGPAYISSGGSFGNRAHEAVETIIGVRPAIWIQKDFILQQ